MNLRLLTIALAAVATSATTQAVVTVTVLPSVASSSSPRTVTQVSPGVYDVTMSTTYALAPVTFTVSGATTDSIRNMSLNASTPQVVWLEVHGPTASEALQSAQSISSAGSTGTVIIRNSRISQDVGTIRVNSVFAAEIGGNITGFIECLPRNGGGQAYIDTMTVGGSILGNVTVNHGFINTLTVAGDLGTASTPINVRVKDYISNITARAIYADIRKPDGVELDVEARRIATTGGPFQGALRLRGWMNWTGGGTPGLYIAGGNLDADVTITGHWDAIADLALDNGYSFVPGRTITIGASLLRAINLPASGLSGQIIVKANNISTHTWTGPVTVGGVGLLPRPYYANLSSTLGGGAVGLVPYGLHKEDCSPAHAPDGGCGLELSTKVWPGQTTRETFVLRHYGPVFNSSQQKPYLVERSMFACPYGTPCPGPWEDITSVCDDYVPGLASGSFSREAWVSMALVNGSPVPFNRDYSYRILLVSDSGVMRLRSAGTLASTAPGVVGYPYEFKPLCFDLNLNLIADPGDIDAWIEQPADVDYSGEIDVADLIRLIETVGM